MLIRSSRSAEYVSRRRCVVWATSFLGTARLMTRDGWLEGLLELLACNDMREKTLELPCGLD